MAWEATSCSMGLGEIEMDLERVMGLDPSFQDQRRRIVLDAFWGFGTLGG